MDNNIVSSAPACGPRRRRALLGVAAGRETPALLGIDNSNNYIYITPDTDVKDSHIHTGRGDADIPIITAAVDREPYVFYRNGYVLHMPARFDTRLG
jgi:hypothetical protein